MGLSWMITSEMRKRRINERIKLVLFAWLRYSEEATENELVKRLRQPTKVLNVEGKPLGKDPEDGTDGIRRELLSPTTAITANLTVTVLTIPPGRELVSQKADGVEFYYVIEGNGIYTLGDSKADFGAGDGFVVDPGR